MKNKFISLLSLCLFGQAAIAISGNSNSLPKIKTELFPFHVSRMAPDKISNITDISSWFPQKAAGSSGFVRTSSTGEFITDDGPIRFWATNLVFDGCFPKTKADAERVAARIARLGYNCVRLHHMDYSGMCIWEGSPNNTTINMRKLDRLDYLIYQLKKRGVYVNINLHVSREFGGNDGFKAPMPTKMGKGINQFEPRMIYFQKKYAKDLLTHINPYTKLSYANDPAVAFIELNNENSLFNWWRYSALDNMPEEYAVSFRKLWNKWLKKKYGTDENLRRAWNVGSKKLGREMLIDTNLKTKNASGKNVWPLQYDKKIILEDKLLNNAYKGHPVRRITVKNSIKAPRPQLIYASEFPVIKGKTYTITFFARSDKSAVLNVNCMKNYSPWGVKLGLDTYFKLSKEWKKYTIIFSASENDKRARISILMAPEGVHEFSNISLKSGGIIGLLPRQSLKNDSVELVKRRGLRRSPRGLRDFIEFVYNAEVEYLKEMYRYIKNELKAKSIISGSQVCISPIGIQTVLDYIDNHVYWHHPKFPKGSSWNKKSSWYVLNEALVNHPAGTIGKIASRRVLGMPYTISEYNHSEPNQFTAEGFPILAAFGAFQNWDGLFCFAYSHRNEYEIDYIPGFFDVNSSPNKLVHMAACVAMYLRRDVDSARKTIAAPFTIGMELKQLKALPNPEKLDTDLYGLNQKWSICHAIGLKLFEKGSQKIRTLQKQLKTIGAIKDKKRFVSDTGQIIWDVSRPGCGVLTVNTRRTKLFTGFADGRNFKLNNFELSEIHSNTGGATISAVCADGKDFKSPGRVLIAASGTAMNKNAVFELLKDNKATLRKNWGKKSPVQCEGISADIKLPVSPERITAYPLDGNGKRLTPLKCSSSEGKTLIQISPRHKTLWYEVVIK